MAHKPDYEVSSVRKALELLCVFSAERPLWTVSDLAREIGIPKSTAHNLLRTLESLDFVAQDPDTKVFRLGVRFLQLGMQYPQFMEVVATAAPYLKRLVEQTRETAKLAVVSAGEALILAAEESPYQLHTRGDAGRRAALHSTGVGKALLANLSEAEIREIIAKRGLPAFTSHTTTGPDRLLREIAKIRRAGYAFDLEESEEGVRCVAAPLPEVTVIGVAAISVSGPSTRIALERMPVLADLVLTAAGMVSEVISSVRSSSRQPHREDPPNAKHHKTALRS